MLSFVSKHCPALYRPHVAELVKVVTAGDGKDGGKGVNEQMVEIGLQALAGVVKSDGAVAPTDK